MYKYLLLLFFSIPLTTSAQFYDAISQYNSPPATAFNYSLNAGFESSTSTSGYTVSHIQLYQNKVSSPSSTTVKYAYQLIKGISTGQPTYVDCISQFKTASEWGVPVNNSPSFVEYQMFGTQCETEITIYGINAVVSTSTPSNDLLNNNVNNVGNATSNFYKVLALQQNFNTGFSNQTPTQASIITTPDTTIQYTLFYNDTNDPTITQYGILVTCNYQTINAPQQNISASGNNQYSATLSLTNCARIEYTPYAKASTTNAENAEYKGTPTVFFTNSSQYPYLPPSSSEFDNAFCTIAVIGSVCDIISFLFIPTTASVSYAMDSITGSEIPFVQYFYSSYSEFQTYSSGSTTAPASTTLSYSLVIPQANIDVEMFSVAQMTYLMGDASSIFRAILATMLYIGLLAMIGRTISRMITIRTETKTV